ncbi:MAG: glycosyltransferase [Lachnospiraceae bacterium]|nr:glycosyltransferase [Lachnospiraceae bacterium]
MAHILFLEWNSYANEYMKRAWTQTGDTFVSFPFSAKGKNTRFDGELTMDIAKALLAEKYDYMFSFNYFPVAAMAAKACRVRYVSWVYDSPYAQLYSETVHYETNDIRIFDRAEVEKLRALGVGTVSYLPMAADVSYYDSLRATDVLQYQSDISFVGSLYTESDMQLYHRLDALLDEDKEYLEGLLQEQKKLYGRNVLEEQLRQNTAFTERLEAAVPLASYPDAFAPKEWYYANFYLYRKVTAYERMDILEMLAGRYDLKVYTHTEDSNIRDNKYSEQLRKALRPKVDYYNQAPYVYKNSKINLNITLRSIGAGIPLRCFDIMGCGGFLLTNYQADLFEFFEPDKDFVYYTDYEDLLEKVDYYLAHDAEREAIARNGYEKVKRGHTYKKRLLNL